ncbi:ribosome silencing factor [Zhongshania aliphaticivorans]|jgi:ribosome-associated protein|uniref:ribosome silencing factor n=1 Tax=Zhongshania aliphaticivorans TaxID=1470434 RepID=UPI0012E57410|nr:ribosome silencing factor [Zhongshania aliphaticivorans]MBQ0760340.1 ribosome silencing factor [Zhongshania sp.]CAA0097506.1 Ribosomal silencing factor RsfS [Zhongshania aliphaticivorans]
MDAEQLKKLVIDSLEDVKGRDIVALDVRDMSGVTDFMVVCSGTSNRHVKSLADNVWVEVKKRGIVPLGMEGENTGDWVLVDLGDVVVHVMLPEARLFYDLERLWQVPVPGSDES